MMTEEMMKQMPHMAGMGAVAGHPVAQGTMLAAAGYAAGKGILGATLLRNPLVLLAAGIAAGYLLHKYEKEIVQAVSRATGMGKDFVLEQKEHLSDLVAEAQEQEAKAPPPAPAATPGA